MTESALSPLYMETPTEKRWKGSRLDALFLQLQADAIQANDEKWHWRVRPDGLVVGLRHVDGGRWELRFARKEELESHAWEPEVKRCLDDLQIVRADGATPCRLPGSLWFPAKPTAEEAKKPIARFLMLRLGEIQPGKALCWDCLQEDDTHTVVEWYGPAGVQGQKCPTHGTRRAEPQFELEPQG